MPPLRTPASRTSAFRQGVERRSAVLLAWLSLRPRLLLPALIIGLLLLAGLLPPLLSALCLLPVLTLVGWLSYLSWPTLDGRARVLRLLVLVGLVVVLLLEVR